MDTFCGCFITPIMTNLTHVMVPQRGYPSVKQQQGKCISCTLYIPLHYDCKVVIFIKRIIKLIQNPMDTLERQIKHDAESSPLSAQALENVRMETLDVEQQLRSAASSLSALCVCCVCVCVCWLLPRIQLWPTVSTNRKRQR